MKKIDTKTISLLIILFALQFQTLTVFSIEAAIRGKSNIKESYALGNGVSILQSIPSASADTVERYNVTLWVRDWENKTSFSNLNVTIFDLEGNKSSSYVSNGTGHVDLFFLNAGSYVISVQSANRIVGYKKINVVQNATYLIRTWAYDLNMTLVDSQGNPLANHTVLLYDQMIFEAPNYTMTTDALIKRQNYTVITEEPGQLVRQAETDENGTLSFSDVWNGTYWLKIIGKETWVEEYVLGERVLKRVPPAAGQRVIDHQSPTNTTLTCTRVDLQFRFLSASNVPMVNATVYTRDVQGDLFFEDLTNKTGFVEHKNVYVIDGKFDVSVRYGNRTVGHKIVEVKETELFTIKCWTNNLTVTCLDLDGKPLADHIVLLYDQMIFYSPTNVTAITNQTGTLVNWTKTDKNGVAIFNDIWNGTYWISVSDGETIKERLIDLQKSKSITVICDKTYMALWFTTPSGKPLPQATVTVFDDEQNIVFRVRTDADGHIVHEGLRVGRYTVSVLWMGTQVWSGSVNIPVDRNKRINCMVYSITLRCVDPFGNSLPKAEVKIEKLKSPWESLVLNLDTDQKGTLSLLMPQGSYSVQCSRGIYVGSRIVNLSRDQMVSITCNVTSIFWFLTVVVVVPLVVVTLFIERRKLKTPLEIRRYKNMLSKLETMYRNGLVEYKIYRKLREEYETKIMELGGREIR